MTKLVLSLPWGKLVLFNLIVDAGSIKYQAQSPDESALVLGAGNFGFVFKVTLSSTTGFLLSDCKMHKIMFSLISRMTYC